MTEGTSSDRPPWFESLTRLAPDIEEFKSEQLAWVQEQQALIAEAAPPSDDYHVALWRLRAFASEAMALWPLQDEYERFQLLALVDAHDAVVDSGAALMSGMGAPAVALLRRAWEMSLLLTAIWQDRDGTLLDLRAALQDPRRHDNLAPLARAGAIGAVMPHASRLRRRAGFAKAESLDEVERGLKSVAHGGVFASGFYRGGDSPDSEQPNVEAARAFLEVHERAATLTSGAASMISERLGFEGTERYAGIFDFSEIEKREDAAMDAFEAAFPSATHAIWASCMGIRSIAAELSEAIGERRYDDLLRQFLVILDGVSTADYAFELLHRGRLIASATVTRRLFELAHETQGWADKPDWMEKRSRKAGDDVFAKYATPPAGSMIDLLYGEPARALQRRTYSSLCSVAHGGVQAHEYLLPDLSSPTPAPAFVYRHHRWLLGTLASTLAQLLQSALIIAGRVNEQIRTNHLGYESTLSGWLRDMPALELVSSIPDGKAG